MTEAEWLKCGSPKPMLEHLGRKASKRKLRLFGCACLRRVWHLLLRVIEDNRPLVELVERYADGAASKADLRAWWDTLPPDPDGTPEREAEERHPLYGPRSISSYAVSRLSDSVYSRSCDIDDWYDVTVCVADAAHYTAVAVGIQTEREVGRELDEEGADALEKEASSAEAKAQAGCLRCIVGNPFRPVSGECVVPLTQLAQGAYDERQLPQGLLDPVRLDVLADAAEDAGCTSNDLLSHLRGPGPHVRGCWAVDLVLGKR